MVVTALLQKKVIPSEARTSWMHWIPNAQHVAVVKAARQANFRMNRWFFIGDSTSVWT